MDRWRSHSSHNPLRIAGTSEMTLHPFVTAVAALRFDNCFNPYSDRCEVHDHNDAPTLRSAALSAMVERATSLSIDAIWIGRDRKSTRLNSSHTVISYAVFC